MKNYIKLFKTPEDGNGYVMNDIPFLAAVKSTEQKINCVEENLALKDVNGELVISEEPTNAVKFTALKSSSTIALNKLSTYQTLEYTFDLGETWLPMTSATTIELKLYGDTVFMRGMLTGDNHYDYYSTSNYTQFKMTGKISASGNCNYLWNYQNPDAPLKKCCGYGMFANCTSLTTSPDLPATQLAERCYVNMFANCTSLTEAPQLPATTLVGGYYYYYYYSGCYDGMFYGCTSLTTAPILAATKLTTGCYCDMFNGCRNLSHVTCLATDISAKNSTNNWLKNVAGEGIFVKNQNKNNWSRGISGIPNDWAVCNYYEPVKFTAEQNNSTIGLDKLSTNQTLEYSGDKIHWTSMTTATTITLVNIGDSVYVRGVLSGNNSTSDYTQFSITGKIAASGNCNSIWKTDIVDTTLKEYCGYKLFEGCTSLTTAPELPETTLSPNCYDNMFMGCTSLTTAPELPAMVLSTDCYHSMFKNCTSLTTAPELPAMVLSTDCYHSMFDGCTNLNYIKCSAINVLEQNYTANWVNGISNEGVFVKSPDATGWTIGINGIPSGWTVENYIPAVKFTAQEDNSTIGLAKLSANQTFQYTNGSVNWVNMSSSTIITLTNSGDCVYIRGILNRDNQLGQDTTFKMTGKIAAIGNCNYLWNYQNPDTPLKQQCGCLLFSGCKSLITTPELPATELSYKSYDRMFSGCTSLTTAPELPATTLAYDCYASMFNGCTSLKTAPELPATTLNVACYRAMFQGCTSLTTAPELPATTLVEHCYNSMFRGCTSLTTAPELPAMTMKESCYAYMFYACTGLVNAPELPAGNIQVLYCYDYMFYGCSSLNYIKCLGTNYAGTSQAKFYTNMWVSGVAVNGTFVKAANVTNWKTGTSGIPSGWTVEDA